MVETNNQEGQETPVTPEAGSEQAREDAKGNEGGDDGKDADAGEGSKEDSAE